MRPLPFGIQASIGRRLLATPASTMTILSQQQQKGKQTYAALPKLPVPNPEKTLSHFREFARVLQDDREFQDTEKMLKSFKQDELQQLQGLLEKRAKETNNWLTPWWLNVAYLAARYPLPVNTSPGVLFPLEWKFNGIEDQIEYAAMITQSALQFYQEINSDRLKQDKAGSAPMDMSQYKYLFGTTRIPKHNVDEIRYGISYKKPPRHIAVFHNGNAVYVPVMDEAGRLFNFADLKAKIKQAVELSVDANPNPVFIISGDNRDTWATAYEELKAEPKNAENLRLLEEALFVVCIDKEAVDPFDDPRNELARQSLHGGGARNNSGNRWFDKTIQFFVGPTGGCGMTYEHTPAEGPPVAALMDYVCDVITHKDTLLAANGVASSENSRRLDFTTTPKINQQIQKSGVEMDKVDADLQISSFVHIDNGTNDIKRFKMSPDSFIQLAFQLFFDRMHKSSPPTRAATYETATLRMFDEGRTENIRFPNLQSAAFIDKTSDFEASTGFQTPAKVAELAKMMRAAIASHKKYATECMQGSGMDRHLLAWNLLASENGLPKPSIIESDAYKKMSHFRISTSQVPTKHDIQMCFGPSHNDCYGICYNPQQHYIQFAVSTFKSGNPYKGARIREELNRAINDLRRILVVNEIFEKKEEFRKHGAIPKSRL